MLALALALGVWLGCSEPRGKSGRRMPVAHHARSSHGAADRHDGREQADADGASAIWIAIRSRLGSAISSVSRYFDLNASTLGHVRQVVRTQQGKIELIVSYSRWWGWFGRPVAVPLEVVGIEGRQFVSLDMAAGRIRRCADLAGRGRDGSAGRRDDPGRAGPHD